MYLRNRLLKVDDQLLQHAFNARRYVCFHDHLELLNDQLLYFVSEALGFRESVPVRLKQIRDSPFYLWEDNILHLLVDVLEPFDDLG